MLSWLSANWGTLLICALLAALVAAILVKMVRDRRRGRSVCGCGCQNCALQGRCRNAKK